MSPLIGVIILIIILVIFAVYTLFIKKRLSNASDVKSATLINKTTKTITPVTVSGSTISTSTTSATVVPVAKSNTVLVDANGKKTPVKIITSASKVLNDTQTNTETPVIGGATGKGGAGKSSAAKSSIVVDTSTGKVSSITHSKTPTGTTLNNKITGTKKHVHVGPKENTINKSGALVHEKSPRNSNVVVNTKTGDVTPANDLKLATTSSPTHTVLFDKNSDTNIPVKVLGPALPAGTVVKPDGTAITPNGTVVKPSGTVIKPDGTVVKPDGTIVKPSGTVVKPDGTVIKPNGTVIPPPSNGIDIYTNPNLNITTGSPIQKIIVPGADPKAPFGYNRGNLIGTCVYDMQPYDNNMRNTYCDFGDPVSCNNASLCSWIRYKENL